MTLASFHGAVEDAFARAAASRPIVRRFVRSAGSLIEIRFAGDALLPLLFPSLRHLEAEAHPAPDLTIDVWDAESTGVAAPPVPHAAVAPAPEARTLWREGPLRLLAEPGTLAVVDVARGRAACVYAARDRVPPWDVGAPFRFLLASWFGARGLQLVHAGAVGTHEGAVLLTAPGGSGKSSTALGCLASGLSFLGDDFVLVGAPPEPPVFSLYAVAKLDPAFLASRLPGSLGSVIGRDPQRGGKALFDVARRDLLAREAPLRAILVPRVGRATRLSPIRPMDAFRSMAPTTALLLPGSGAEALERMSLLVRSLPCYALELGGDVAEIARAVSEVVATACASA